MEQNKMKKQFLCLLFAALLLTSCGVRTEEGYTRSFTDSLGRTVMIPENPKKVAASGTLAQLVLFSLCPEKLAGITSEWDAETFPFLEESYRSLPILGHLYGGKGDLNPESLLASGAELVIDIGEAKDAVADDLDQLQAQIGIPFVHIHAQTEKMGETYRLLGALLGAPEQAEKLAEYCDSVYSDMYALSQHVEKRSVLYITGTKGLNVIAKGSYHAEILDLLCENAAVLDEPSAKGSGNEVDFEQLLLWNPDVILFSPDSIFDSVSDDPTWNTLRAIREGRFYEVPLGPYNWMGFPPSVQRYLGMLWMAKLLYPEEAAYDLFDEVSRYFRLFYHTEITEAQYSELVRNSILK